MRCALCGSTKMIQEHHLFSNTKLNRKLYGKLIEDPRNKAKVCESCHLWKPIPKWDEITFCRELGIIPRSKIGKQRWQDIYGTAYL